MIEWSFCKYRKFCGPKPEWRQECVQKDIVGEHPEERAVEDARARSWEQREAEERVGVRSLGAQQSALPREVMVVAVGKGD